MIITHIITAFGFGGAEKLLVDLANLQCEHHQVHIIYLKGRPEIKILLSGKVHVHHVPLGFKCTFELRSLLKKIRPDIVHTHVGHADLIGAIASRGLNAKQFCTKHNTLFQHNWKDRIYFAAYTVIFNTVARNVKFISISRAVSEHIEKVLHISKERIYLVHNAIPAVIEQQNRDKLRHELAITREAFCVLFVGRLEIPKSVDTLLRAVPLIKSKIPGLEVVIVGEGSLRKSLEALSEDLNVTDCVRFAGGSSQTSKYYAAADIFVLPSIFEGFGIVIVEAFRASLPVIASNIEGPKEIVDHGVTGLLFEPRNFEMLADQITQLHAAPELRAELGANGYKEYLCHYDIRNYTKRMEELYHQ